MIIGVAENSRVPPPSSKAYAPEPVKTTTAESIDFAAGDADSVAGGVEECGMRTICVDSKP